MYTPNGLKIRIEQEYGMNQEFKQGTDVYDLLIQTEIYATLRDYLAFIFSIIVFMAGADFPIIFRHIFSITLIGIFIPEIYPLLKTYQFLSFLFLKRIFTYFSGFFIDKIIIIAVGLFYTSWKEVIAYFLAFYSAILVGHIINLFWSKIIFQKHNIFIGDVERIFINISRLHLKRRLTLTRWINNYREYMTQKV